MTYKYSFSDLNKIAADLANNIVAPHTILLVGDLGAGKTTFAQIFIKTLNKDANVASPTFNIMNLYETQKGTICHADLYRLKNIEELENLGLIEFTYTGIALIEWPDLIKPYLKCKTTTINL